MTLINVQRGVALGFAGACSIALLSVTSAAAANPTLQALNIDTRQTSVSGLSSGGYMATQFQLAHSEHVVGAGIVGAGPYYCALGQIGIALGQCVNKASSSITNTPFLAQYETYLAEQKLAPRDSLQDDRVVIIHGTNDTTVNRTAANLLAEQYKQWLPANNVKYINDEAFAHHMPTESYGSKCEVSESPFLGNCNYDAAGTILSFIYPNIQAPPDVKNNNSAADSALQVSTIDLSDLTDLSATSISDDAFIFIPEDCAQGKRCRLHISFHGCNQSASDVGRQYAQHAGFNRWAQNNDIVVLYPQVKKSMFMPLNPQGCWDWWGYTDENYANKSGPQIKAIYQAMQALGKE